MSVPPSVATPDHRVVAMLGNPNTGKSALFNALTGLRQKVGNYPGVTVEKHLGFLKLGETNVQLVDLPGLYSLAAHSPDELLALDVLLGRVEDVGRPDAVLVVVDTSNLRRNLFLVTQIVELGLPVVVALNMMDAAEDRGIELDIVELQKRLGAKAVGVVATRGRGLDELREALANTLQDPQVPTLDLLPELKDAARELAAGLASDDNTSTVCEVAVFEVERALIDQGGAAEQRFADRLGKNALDKIETARRGLGHGMSLAEFEARRRYDWIASLLRDTMKVSGGRNRDEVSERIDRVVVHPVFGSLIFVSLMAVVFQAVFSWAEPLMELIEGVTGQLGELTTAVLGEGALGSLAADGIIAGVGSVIVFLPQILILFLFILLLEDTGYMARAAFLMDRVMKASGLSGHSFIPMLSSFACAIPGIMATRVIPDRRDRLATILAAPFMTCAARLPVYALLIAAFVPGHRYLGGLLNLQGLVLLGLYLLGILGGVATALLLKRTLLKGPTPTFLLELPPYRWPSARSIFLKLFDRAKIFLKRAGTLIFTVTVVVWALSYFPRPNAIAERYDQERQGVSGEALTKINNQEAAEYLEQSALGRLGKIIQPVFRPLDWDWKVSAAVLAAFPAREVVIAVLGTIYAVGSEVDEKDEGLLDRIRGATWPDGRLVFSLPMALGLMVFFAFCLQCGATVATIRRETQSWGWPIFAWTYMTTLAYIGAFVTIKLAELWIGA